MSKISINTKMDHKIHIHENLSKKYIYKIYQKFLMLSIIFKSIYQ